MVLISRIIITACSQHLVLLPPVFLTVIKLICRARPNVQELKSLFVFLEYIEYFDPRIPRLLNYETFGREREALTTPPDLTVGEQHTS